MHALDSCQIRVLLPVDLTPGKRADRACARPHRFFVGKGTELDDSMGSYGIDVLDRRLAGPAQGGLHAVIGGPGTGKTVVALHYLMGGLRAGSRVALLTQARPEDVIALAEAMGMDLRPALDSGRWIMLGYQQGFRERYRRTIDAGEVFEELRRFVNGDAALGRLAIDTCGPLIEWRESGNGAELLVELLGELGSTSLLSFAAEYPGMLDSGFDLISQRASLILHLTLASNGCREMMVRKSTTAMEVPGPISFDIEAGRGIVPPTTSRRKRRSDVTPEVKRRVLMTDVAGELPDELRIWLEETFDLAYHTDPVDAFPELARREFGLVVVHVDRRTVGRGLHVMKQLRRAAGRPPILVLCPVDVRASDRAEALRTGADDFVSGGLNPEEVAWRMEALLRRGRTEPEGEEEPLEKPKAAQQGDVRAIVRGQLAAPGASIFSFVILRPSNGRGLRALANHVTERMRRDTGDVVSVVEDHIEVYLHGAMANHAERFLKRVRVEPFRDVAADVYTAPTDRKRLLEVVGS